MIGNLRIDLFVWCWEKWVVEKPLNPMDGLRVECVGNRRHESDNIGPSFYFVYVWLHTNKHQFEQAVRTCNEDRKR